jgi:drug/metabolite transporter (DMT)-like permease
MDAVLVPYGQWMRTVAGLSLLGALLAAVCFGASSILQARASRTAPASVGLDPRLLARLLRSWLFLAALGVDLLGFVAEFAALRTLPLFLVQAAVAASLAVTAVLAARLLGERLTGREWLAVGAVCGGLAVLGVSAGPEGGAGVGGRFSVGLAVLLAAVLAVAAVVARRGEPLRSILLGVGAGLGFGVVALAARTLTDLRPLALLANPSLYLLAAGGVVGFLLYATALQRGAVAMATAALVLSETVVPAAVGTLLLGDRARPGLGWLAAVGFAVAIGGAVALARFGEIDS